MINWWRKRSLLFRLSAWYAGGGVVLLTGFSAVIYGFVQGRMAQPLDQQLRADMAEVRAHLTLGADRSVAWDGQVLQQGDSGAWSGPWFEVWDVHGNLMLRRWLLDEKRLEQLPYAPVAGWETLALFNVAPDLRLRVLSAPLIGGNAREGAMLRVMRVHRPAADALGALFLVIIVALPIVVALLVVVGYLLSRHWLHPLQTMVSEAECIHATDLSKRLPIENPHDELGRLAVVFNGVIERLEASFTTLDRFAADASHELRTPLTTLRSVGEVALQRSRSGEEYREVIASMLEEAQRLQGLVERLLELARTSAEPEMEALRAVRLDRVASECEAEFMILAEEKGQRIELALEPCEAEADELWVRQVVRNLLDNAIKYSPVGAKIVIGVKPRGDQCELWVSDEGQGIPVELRGRVLERFFRGDSARGAGGYGLGLALSEAYARAMGGGLRYTPLEPRGSRFTLTLRRHRHV